MTAAIIIVSIAVIILSGVCIVHAKEFEYLTSVISSTNDLVNELADGYIELTDLVTTMSPEHDVLKLKYKYLLSKVTDINQEVKRLRNNSIGVSDE